MVVIVKRRRQRSPLPLVIFALLCALGATGYFYWKQVQARRAVEVAQKAQFPGETQKQEAQTEQEERFWAMLDKRKPVYTQVERECYVEGTKFKVTTGNASQDNAYGGVLTDLMKLALNPPPKHPGRPTLELQNFDQLLSTCPICGATYFDIDFTDINSGRPAGAADKLRKSFNLHDLAPELDALDKRKWTYDEKSFARFLTQQAAGFPDSELGYTALSGAYCSNLSVAVGRDYRITGAAFYALAAAEFKRQLTSGQYANKAEGSLIALAQGEMYRLLARPDDAKKAYAQARSIGGITDQKTLDVLKFLEDLNNKADYTLQMAPLKGMTQPPIGWYANMVLPNVNAELEVQREKWGKLDDPAEIIKQMRHAIEVGPDPVKP